MAQIENPSCARILPKGLVLDLSAPAFSSFPSKHPLPHPKMPVCVPSCFLVTPSSPALMYPRAVPRWRARARPRCPSKGDCFLADRFCGGKQTWRAKRKTPPRRPTARAPQRPRRPRADAPPTVQHTPGRKTKKVIACDSLQSQLPIYSFMR